jgi:hypothetical protein
LTKSLSSSKSGEFLIGTIWGFSASKLMFMRQLLTYTLVGASAFASGVFAQRALNATKIAANMVWVAHYFPDVAVDLFDSMHRPTADIEDPLPIDDLMAPRVYCRND